MGQEVDCRRSKLTNLEGLKQADSQALYKGGIRSFGEELFTFEVTND